MKYLEPTDKVKTCLEILQDAQMDIRNHINKPVRPEVLLKEVLLWYKITERQLYLGKVKRVYMFLLYEICFLSFEEIAEMTRCKSELEVVRGIEKIQAAMKKDSIMLADIGGIVDRIKHDYPKR